MPENNVECPQCGRLFRVPGELLGHRFRCLKCYTVFETSAPAASAAAFQAASAATALPHALALPQIGTPARHGPRRTRRRSSEPDEWWADPLMLVVGLLLVVWLGMAVLYVSVHWTPLFILLVLGGLSACVLGAIRLAQRRDSRAPYTGSAAAVVVGVGLLFGLFPVSLLADWVARQSSEPHGQADTVAQDQPSRFPPTAPPA
ncbi:MAG TPA: hypothetical protein VFA18_12290, partial [Gemmataceae bacterium]|nr:hypothetical protein [Gemmataceae bacterium]